MNLALYSDRLFFILCSVFFLLISFPASVLAETCSETVAKVVSVQGVVETRSKSNAVWNKITLEQDFCAGDMIRTAANSRAAFYLNNNTILRLNELSAVSFTDISQQQRSWLDLEQGMAHFISRIKQSFEVVTPYVNAAVDGTEFVVSVVDNYSEVTVLEGRVRVSNDRGEFSLSNGQTVVAKASAAPALRVDVQPWDAVRWALHYPLIVDFITAPDEELPEQWKERLAKSVNYYIVGDLTAALAELEILPDDLSNNRTNIYRAELYLMVGQVAQANSALDTALKLDTNNGDAIALKSIIAVVNNDNVLALALARQAVDASPKALSPLLAMSYAQQAMFNLQQARQTLEHAVILAPNSALAWARLAELQLMFGELDQARISAQRAVDISPNLARTQSVLGFSHLAQIDMDMAEQAFQHAIQLDQTEPLPRLGLGLVLIRRGELEAGRRQIEYAASLDPANPLIRSYLGKAYYEEKRNPLAADQLDMAKELDPNDPTPWFYDAIRKQSENRPVAALQDLQQSSKLNDNRAVYRSRLLLDEDVAARNASLAQLYLNLGAAQLALTEADKSLSHAPNNHSAHRLLSETYSGLPRHEVARVSELLQSQLLQPMNLDPVSPQLAEGSLYHVDDMGPATVSYNEFHPLFSRNRIGLATSLVYGSDNMKGDDLVVSGIHNSLSYSLGQFHYETDGFRENNDLEHDIFNLFMQYAISPSLNAQIEARTRNSTSGDLEFRFNPDDFRSSERRQLDEDTLRFGLHFSPEVDQDYLVSVISNDVTDSLSRGSFTGNKQDEGRQAEVQHMFASERLRTTFGIGYLKLDSLVTETIDLPPFFFDETNTERDIDQSNAYFYTQFFTSQKNILTLGLSYVDLDEENGINLDQLSPKLGFQVMPSQDLTIRMAAFQGLMRKILSNQTVEPTQVTGFNQFFEDTLGTDSTRYGLAADYQITSKLFVGAELTARELTTLVETSGAFIEEEQNERSHQAYLNYFPHPSYGLGMSYDFERFYRESIAGEANSDIPAYLRTHSLPFDIKYFHPNRFSLGFTMTYVTQEVRYATESGFDKDEDNFWVADASFAYLFPKRYGQIKLVLKNISDEDFKFQSTNFISNEKRQSPFSPDRSFYLVMDLHF